MTRSLSGAPRPRMLQRCSPSPRHRLLRSAPSTGSAASYRQLLSCAGCSPASPTIDRPGNASARSPAGSRSGSRACPAARARKNGSGCSEPGEGLQWRARCSGRVRREQTHSRAPPAPTPFYARGQDFLAEVNTNKRTDMFPQWRFTLLALEAVVAAWRARSDAAVDPPVERIPPRRPSAKRSGAGQPTMPACGRRGK
jgi:hypothetical protein